MAAEPREAIRIKECVGISRMIRLRSATSAQSFPFTLFVVAGYSVTHVKPSCSYVYVSTHSHVAPWHVSWTGQDCERISWRRELTAKQGLRPAVVYDTMVKDVARLP